MSPMARRKATPEKRVVGIGGIFFKARNPEKLSGWYRDHLGMSINGTMATFTWNPTGRSGRNKTGYTVWSIFPSGSDYFSGKKGSPGTQRFMINYRVGNLRALLKKLKSEGVKVDEKVEEYDYGKFGWVTDPEGNRIELWEPSVSSEAPEKSVPME
jgi:predicted enzyme related to lactoylglutathione lyase